MFKKLLASKKFLLVLAILTFVALLLNWARPSLVPPTLISSAPANNSRNVGLTAPLELQFDGPVDPADFSLTSVPEAPWNINSVSAATLSLSLTPTQSLAQNTKYTLNILWQGRSLTTLVFTTESTQTDRVLLDRLAAELQRDYPLANFVPYETALYRVIYISPRVLEITLKNPNFTSEEAINDIRQWVTSKGGDAASHTYTVATP